MTANNEVYINALGKFLPGKPVCNEEIENYLGLIGGKPSRLKSRILKQNGIQTRHYALEPCGKVNFSNYELAAKAIENALANSEIESKNI